MEFQIFKTDRSTFFFRLRFDNGVTPIDSREYRSKETLMQSINLIKQHSANAEIKEFSVSQKS